MMRQPIPYFKLCFTIMNIIPINIESYIHKLQFLFKKFIQYN